MKRDKNIIVRVSEKEKKKIKRKSDKINLSLSEYSREILSNGEIKLMNISDKVELKKIGININQIAKRLNFSNQLKFSELKNQLEKLDEILKNIQEESINFSEEPTEPTVEIVAEKEETEEEIMQKAMLNRFKNDEFF